MAEIFLESNLKQIWAESSTKDSKYFIEVIFPDQGFASINQITAVDTYVCPDRLYDSNPRVHIVGGNITH